MYLELLSNELFLDLFEYLSSVDLFQTFYNLNIRLNNLIFFHLKTHSLNFQFSSKYNFNLICHKYISSITDRIISLRLSDNDNTPNQIELFFSYGLSFQQFSNLQSLSIDRIYSLNSLNLLINQFIYLPYLIHLSITRYFIVYNEEYNINIINSIQQYLSKLISCHLDITNDNEYGCSILSMNCLSLKYLSLPYLDCTIKQLFYLIQHIINLRTLIVCITDYSKVLSISMNYNFSSIKIFKLKFDGSFNNLKTLLKTMSNLEELKIEMSSLYINGYQWENLIENHLLNLISFQFKMWLSLFYEKTREEQINEILNSFHNQFWIEKHHWFVQCYWTLIDKSSAAYVYTLPYAFRDIIYLDKGQLKSTCSNNESFNYVHNLHYGLISSNNSSLSPIYFNNIRYLYIMISVDDQLIPIISKFDRLETLKVTLYDEMNEIDQLKLQFLLDQLIHLRLLIFFSWTNKNKFPLELKNSSIRQLDLRGPSKLFYNNQQCQQLIHSSIIQQCEILFINIEQQNDIIHFINQLKNLRILIIKCLKLKINENLIECLKQYSLLSSSNITNSEEIRLWIR